MTPQPPEDLPEGFPDGLVVPDDLSSLFGPSSSEQSTDSSTDSAESLRGQGDPDDAAQEGETGDASDSGESGESDEPKVISTTAVVLTTIRQAKVLAGLLSLSGIDAAVVPSRRGAIAVRYVEQLAAEVDPSELLSGIPLEAEALGAALSVAARSEVVLLAARVQEVGGEISGQVKARRYRGGQIVGEPPPGLVLAQAEAVAERLLIGLVQAPQVEGYISSSDLLGGGGRSFFGRRRRESEDEA